MGNVFERFFQIVLISEKALINGCNVNFFFLLTKFDGEFFYTVAANDDYLDMKDTPIKEALAAYYEIKERAKKGPVLGQYLFPTDEFYEEQLEIEKEYTAGSVNLQP